MLWLLGPRAGLREEGSGKPLPGADEGHPRRAPGRMAQAGHGWSSGGGMTGSVWPKLWTH